MERVVNIYVSLDIAGYVRAVVRMTALRHDVASVTLFIFFFLFALARVNVNKAQ